MVNCTKSTLVVMARRIPDVCLASMLLHIKMALGTQHRTMRMCGPQSRMLRVGLATTPVVLHRVRRSRAFRAQQRACAGERAAIRPCTARIVGGCTRPCG